MKKYTLYLLTILSISYSYSQSADILLNGTVSTENNQIKNVAEPTDATDAVNLEFLQNEISNSHNPKNIGLTGVMHNNYDGEKYRTIVMCDGNQWTIDFLRSTHFNNGDEIPIVQDAGEWSALSNAAKSYYPNSGNPYNNVGFMYNWFVVEDDRGIAPDGWRIATVNDWDNIIECLGGQGVAGGKIKYVYDPYDFWDHSMPGWYNDSAGSSLEGLATNSSGLSLKASGFREGANGNFYGIGEQVIIWAKSDESQPRVEVFGNSAGVLTGLTDPYDGYYILLVKE
tara:strand:+ start:91 stop:942 length:852 start_codon:yes stop_codon:yes gene_type:complete